MKGEQKLANMYSVGQLWGPCSPPTCPPPLAPALLQALEGVAALGGCLLQDAPPHLSHGYGPCLDLLRVISRTIILVVARVALAASRDTLAATTFTFSLVLLFLFAFDVFITYRTEVAPVLGRDPDMDST